MNRVNNTGQDHEILWCSADHWGERGYHAPGDYEDCIESSAVIHDGGKIVFDESADNGQYIKDICDSKDFD